MGCAQEILLRVENIEKYYGGLGTVTRALISSASMSVRESISVLWAPVQGGTTLLISLTGDSPERQAYCWMEKD